MTQETDMTGKTHIRCEKCGHCVMVPDEKRDNIVIIAMIGFADGRTLQRNIPCDNCKERGGLVLISSEGNTIGAIPPDVR